MQRPVSTTDSATNKRIRRLQEEQNALVARRVGEFFTTKWVFSHKVVQGDLPEQQRAGECNGAKNLPCKG